MNLLDLFSGIGGFSLAAHKIGWQTVAFIEKDPFCQEVLLTNFPGIPIYGDIYNFGAEQLIEIENYWRSREVNRHYSIDLLTAGFP